MMYRKNKKGQAALEFLTTYGWAFLVIIVVFGLLVRFDVFNLEKRMPAKVDISGFQGESVITTDSEGKNAVLHLELKTTTGKTIKITSISNNVTAMYGEEKLACEAAEGDIDGQYIAAGNPIKINCNFPEALVFNPGDKVSTDIKIVFVNQGSTLKDIGTGTAFSSVVG